MARVLIVAQDKGGVGKSTAVRAVAELAPEVAIIELDVASRLIEYQNDSSVQVNNSRLSLFQVGVDPAALERTGGQAALSQFDNVIEAISEAKVPTVVDVGANTAQPFLKTLGNFAGALQKDGISFGILCVTTADPAAIAEAEKILTIARPWASKVFVLENRVHGPVDSQRLKVLAKEDSVSLFEHQRLDEASASILLARGLRDIPYIDSSALRKAFGMALSHRMIASLQRFRTEVMEAVRTPCAWLMAGPSLVPTQKAELSGSSVRKKL